MQVDAPLGVGVHDLLDRRLVGAEAVAAMHERHALGGVEQVDDPVAGAVAAADDDHALALELALGADEVVRAAALPGGHVVVGQLLGLEGAVPAGDDHGARAQVALVGVQDDEVVLPRDRVGRGLQMHGHVELLDRLLAVQLDEVLGQDLGVAGNVEDPLLRIERRELAAELGQRVDDARAGLAHAGPEGRGQAHRPRADHRDVADVVEVGVAHGMRDCRAGTGSPSMALSARSTEVAMQVKLGVSRRV